MSLGEIAGGDLRAYYKLEGLTDSSGNGFTLTNNNSVSFATQGKFNYGADFGSSGTNKGLTYTGNILSGTNPSNWYCSLWFKLNNTTSAASPAVFWIIRTGGFIVQSIYTISAGNITITTRRMTNINTVGSSASTTFTADTNWHKLTQGSTSGQLVSLELDMQPIITGSGTFTDNTASAALSIGNSPGLASQCFSQIDQCYFVEESPSRTRRQIIYTYEKGRFCI